MMTTSTFRLNRRAVLQFFDEAPSDSRRHATAVCAVMGEDLGIGLLQHYLMARTGATVTVGKPCNKGTARGHRLDAWVKSVCSHRSVLFQVEVKNWSAHAIGGRPLALDATPEQVAAYKIERFHRYFDPALGTITNPALVKVLEPMRTTDATPVAPLACMWYAMHPTGGAEALFSVPLQNHGPFQEVWFFSMSGYLRSLTTEYVEIPMNDTLHRLRTMRSFLGDDTLNL